MEAGHSIAVTKDVQRFNLPYFIAAPLPPRDCRAYKGLPCIVLLYAVLELDTAIDTVVLGGLEGNKIALVPERDIF